MLTLQFKLFGRFAFCLVIAWCMGGCTPGVPLGAVQEVQWQIAPSPETIQKNNAIRLWLWNTANAGKGTATAKKRLKSYEGGYAIYYVTVRDGAIESIQDYRNDPWGRPGVVRDRVDQWRIGHLDSERRFHAGTEAPEGAELLLRFALPGRGDCDF